MRFREYVLLFAGLVFSGALFSQVQKDREPKKPVDIKAELARRIPGMDENAIFLTGEVVFHHNGAVISCDSAVRYSDRHIDCFRNVIINKDSTFVYGDRVEYNGDRNMARVYSPVVKVVDGDATLYTYNFTFNTLDNVGIYYGGGVVYQKDNILESEKGYYYSDLREIVAVRNVQMKNDDYKMVSDSVRYNMDTKIASFYTPSYIWTTEGDILRADRGNYNTQDSTFLFRGNSYVLTDFREAWADSINYNAKREDALFFGNIQINDEDNLSSAFGDYGQYWGERGETMMTRRPSIMNYNEGRNNSDTIYMRADTIYMQVIYPGDRPKRIREGAAADPHAHLRFADTLPRDVRLHMADSLVSEISALRTEAAILRMRADSTMKAMYPERTNLQPPRSEQRQETHSGVPADSTVQDAGKPVGNAGEIMLPDILQDEGSAGGRDKRRRGGPDPSHSWIYYRMAGDSASLGPTARDSLHIMLPPTSTDTLTPIEKIRELLPDELSGREPSSLLEILENDPESLSQFISDSIDAAALRSVLETEAAAGPGEPPVTVPSEVEALRKRAEELTARADSLQTAEAYIRPGAAAGPSGEFSTPDSLVRIPESDDFRRIDSLRVADSLSHIDKKNPEGYGKKAEKALKHKLRAEKKAAKQKLREEKMAAREEKRAAREAERRRKLIAKGRIIFTDTLPAPDSLATGPADSLKTPFPVDSLVTPAEGKTEKDSVERIFYGYYNVKIWRKDMQAVCDSITGFSRDSTVHMYVDPILWHAESQIVSDSLTMHTKGENMDFAEFFGNPIMSSKVAGKQFNQVTGRTMTSHFRDNEVYRHDIHGNAEAFYYIQEEDDPTPVAFIVATSSNMTFLMEEQFVRYIIARQNVEWPVYPLDQIPSNQSTELKGFEWYESLRPELADVFDRSVRLTEREFHESLEQPEFPIAARINRRREYLIENRMWADRVDPLPVHAVEYVISLQNR